MIYVWNAKVISYLEYCQWTVSVIRGFSIMKDAAVIVRSKICCIFDFFSCCWNV